MTTELTRVKLDMPCICSSEGKADADDLRAKVRESLKIADHDDFVSSVVADLWWTYQCTITGVYMDMWFGVNAENETESFFLPCDRVEDGLAVIWDYHKTTKPEGAE